MLKVRKMILGEGIPKIALPVMVSDVRETAARCEEAVRAGADLIELRADSSDLADSRTLLEACREAAGELPILFTLRTAAEGGHFKGDEDAYASAILNAMRSGLVDLIDVEHRHPRSQGILDAASASSFPVVLSFHNFSSTPGREELLKTLREMELRGAGVAKIACMPVSDADVYTLIAVSAEAKKALGIPYLVIGMGEKGKVTRISAESYGSAMTFGCFPHEASAPGQIEIASLMETLRKLHGVCEKRKEAPCLFLTGFMGTGKSTVARAIGRSSGQRVIEMDEEIVRRAGKPIPAIFAEAGESAFRDMETELLTELYKEEGTVVSCGGGAVLRAENRAIMRALGRVVLLSATPETLFDRLSRSPIERPKLKGRMSVEGISELMALRLPAYEAAADLRIATDGLSVSEIAGKVWSEAVAGKV